MNQQNEFKERCQSLGPVLVTDGCCHSSFIDKISIGDSVCLDYKNDDNKDIDCRVCVHITEIPASGQLEGNYKGEIYQFSPAYLTPDKLAIGQEVEFDFKHIMSVSR